MLTAVKELRTQIRELQSLEETIQDLQRKVDESEEREKESRKSADAWQVKLQVKDTARAASLAGSHKLLKGMEDRLLVSIPIETFRARYQ